MNLRNSKIGVECLVGDGAHTSIKRQEEGIIYLSSKNFKKEGIDLSKVDFISKTDYNKFFREKSNALTKPKAGDLLMGIIGSIGAPYLYKEDDIFGLSSSVCIIRPHSKELSSEYLYYWMLSPTFQKTTDSIKSGSAQGFLSLQMIRSLPLEYPLLSTQTKIANILSAYNDLIENNQKRIHLLENMAQGLYKEWFVRFRFPKHEEVEFVDGLPKGWKEKKLKSFGKIITGKTPSKKIEDNFGDEILFIKTPDIRGQLFIFNTNEMLSEKGANSQHNQTIPPNSIIVSCIGTVGVGLVAITSRISHTNQQINAIIPNNLKDLEYLFFAIKGLKKIINLFGATGATMTNLSKGKLEKLTILQPIESIINHFHKVIEPLFLQIKNLQNKNNLLKQTRNRLLPRLLSGKLEV